MSKTKSKIQPYYTVQSFRIMDMGNHTPIEARFDTREEAEAKYFEVRRQCKEDVHFQLFLLKHSVNSKGEKISNILLTHRVEEKPRGRRVAGKEDFYMVSSYRTSSLSDHTLIERKDFTDEQDARKYFSEVVKQCKGDSYFAITVSLCEWVSEDFFNTFWLCKHRVGKAK